MCLNIPSHGGGVFSGQGSMRRFQFRRGGARKARLIA